MEQEIWDILKTIDEGKLSIMDAHKKLCGLFVVSRCNDKEKLSKCSNCGEMAGTIITGEVCSSCYC
jgi:hypothetical protein